MRALADRRGDQMSLRENPGRPKADVPPTRAPAPTRAPPPLPRICSGGAARWGSTASTPWAAVAHDRGRGKASRSLPMGAEPLRVWRSLDPPTAVRDPRSVREDGGMPRKYTLRTQRKRSSGHRNFCGTCVVCVSYGRGKDFVNKFARGVGWKEALTCLSCGIDAHKR